MKISPWILGAAALVPVAGAVAGANVNTRPITVAADISDLLPESSSAAIAFEIAASQQPLPDHYAMETPEGRIEAAELAWYGRYRNRRMAYAGYADVSYGEEAGLTAQALDAQQPDVRNGPQFAEAAPRYAPAGHIEVYEPVVVAAYDPVVGAGSQGFVPPPEPLDAVMPAQIADADFSATSSVRVINVQAELASQK